MLPQATPNIIVKQNVEHTENYNHSQPRRGAPGGSRPPGSHIVVQVEGTTGRRRNQEPASRGNSNKVPPASN